MYLKCTTDPEATAACRNMHERVGLHERYVLANSGWQKKQKRKNLKLEIARSRSRTSKKFAKKYRKKYLKVLEGKDKEKKL